MLKTKFCTSAIATLGVILLCSQSVVEVSASQPLDSCSTISVSPQFEYASSATAGLKISSGKATVSGSVIGYSHIADKITMYVYLQRYENGTWKTVESFYENFAHYRGTLEETVQIDSGYVYRVKGSFYVYDNSNFEHITKYSATIRY